MSRYFSGLRRLQKERHEPSPPAPTLPPMSSNGRSQSAASDETQPPTRSAIPVAEPSTAAAAEFANLFENLRVLGNNTIRTVVVAGVSAAESVRTVTTGLTAQLERLGISVLVAELAEWRSRTVLRTRTERAGILSSWVDPLPLDLHGRVDLSYVTDWLERNAGDAGFVIIEGQPLAESIDSALIARATDGLVMVVETEVTSRHALRIATERAKMAGCRTMGIVMYKSNDRTPAWLRRFIISEHASSLTHME